MPVIRLRQPLKRLAGELKEHEVEAATVVAALAALEAANPGLRGWVLDERGHLRRHINAYLNGELAAQDDAVAAGDRIDVIPAISGG